MDKVQLGLPGGKGEQDAPSYRRGAWAPVYVKIKAGPDGNARDQYKVRVQGADGESALFYYEAPLPALAANDDYIAVAYTRPGGGNFGVSLVAADGTVTPADPKILPPPGQETLDPAQPLYLSVGSRLTRGMAADADPDNTKAATPFAHVDDVAHMPDRWFGYDAVDVVVLTTGGEVVEKLGGDAAADRREALAEWVRRGGKLIVSVGANWQVTADVLKRMQLIHCDINGVPVTCPEATNLARWLDPEGRGHARSMAQVEFTRLHPGEGVTVLVSESCKEGGTTVECPVVVESSCGLGRVWLTAFDLEQGAFAAPAASDLRKAFWAKVQSEFTPKPPAPPQPMQPAWHRGRRRRRAAGPARPTCTAPWKTSNPSNPSASAGWPCSS